MSTIIVGVDPGIVRCGVAIYCSESNRFLYAGDTHEPKRVKGVAQSDDNRIWRHIVAIIATSRRYGVDVVACEAQYVATQVKQLQEDIGRHRRSLGSAMAEVQRKAEDARRLARVNGALLGWAATDGLEFVEVPIQTAKRSLTGNPKAQKGDMVRAIQQQFAVNTTSEHIADAGGIALGARRILQERNLRQQALPV